MSRKRTLKAKFPVKPYNKIGKKYGLRKFNNFLELIEGDYTLLADISVIHGGQNTVMQACLSGNPIVGMGMHPEQEANLESCVRKGFAVRLNKWKVEASEVLEAIDKLLHDNKAKEEAKRFQKELMKWDGPSNAAKFLYDTFGK